MLGFVKEDSIVYAELCEAACMERRDTAYSEMFAVVAIDVAFPKLLVELKESISASIRESGVCDIAVVTTDHFVDDSVPTALPHLLKKFQEEEPQTSNVRITHGESLKVDVIVTFDPPLK